MYESFYGLTGKPFQLNPDPSFYFGSRQHRRAMAYLEYGLHQNEGFIVITGEVGAGKTTIVRSLLDKLDEGNVVAAQLVSTQLDAEDTLRMVGGAFGLPSRDIPKAEMLLTLETFLVGITQQGKRALLIVDEAQNLTPRAVEELRMLSNFQLGTHALLQSFLVGQPEFRQTMQSAHMLQLRQRVIAACHIGPMDPEETRGYIEHRLTKVGWKGVPQFEPAAYEAIHRATGGIPRRINAVCDRMLLSGFLAGSRGFGADEVEAVVREIREETFSAPVPVEAEGDAPPSPGADRGGESTVVKSNGADGRVAHSSADPLMMLRADLDFDSKTARDASRLIAGLQASDVDERLTRLERQAAATLALLQQLLDAIRSRPPDPGAHP